MTEDPTLDRLARLLGTDREELAELLDGVSEAQRVALAEHVADSWEARDEKTLKAVLSLLGVLPDMVSAKVAQKRMPARFVARIAPHLSEGSFVSLVGRLKPEFLAEISVWLDHPRCREVLRAIPREHFLPAAQILERRGDWDTLAAVGRELGDETLAACVATFDRTALLEDMERREPAHAARVRAALPS